MAGRLEACVVVILSMWIGNVASFYAGKCASDKSGLKINCMGNYSNTKVLYSIFIKSCQSPPTLSFEPEVGGHGGAKIIDATGVDYPLPKNYTLVVTLKALNMEGEVETSIKMKYRKSPGEVIETVIYTVIGKDPKCNRNSYMYKLLMDSLANFTHHLTTEEKRQIYNQSVINVYIATILRYVNYTFRCDARNGGIRCTETLLGLTAHYGIDMKLCQKSPTASLFLDIDAVNVHFKRNHASVINIPNPYLDNSSFVLSLKPLSNDGNVEVMLKMVYFLDPQLAKIYKSPTIDIILYKGTEKDTNCNAKLFWHNSVRNGVLGTISNAVLKKEKYDDATKLFVKNYISELYPSKSQLVMIKNHELTVSYVASFLGKKARIDMFMNLCRCSRTTMLLLDLEALGIHARKNATFMDTSIATNISVRLTTSASYGVDHVKVSAKLSFVMSPFNITLAEIPIHEGTVQIPTCAACNDKTVVKSCDCDATVVGVVVFFIVTLLYTAIVVGHHYYRRGTRNKEAPPTDFTTGKGSDGTIPKYTTSYERHQDVPT